jgi:benzoyl-CoA reductase subunit B
MKGQIWETRPLEFWDKAKELREKWEKSTDHPDKIVGQGNTVFGLDWAQAFPNIVVIEDNPRGSTIAAKYLPESRRYRLASDIRGWGREICGYHGVFWGEQFLGTQPDGTPFAERQFVVPFPCVCDLHTKRGQQARDFKNIPQWSMDRTPYFGSWDPQQEAPRLDHTAWCTFKVINDMERIFGQKFDDEKMVELIRASKAINEYYAETFYYVTYKPAPLSVKDIYSIMVLGGLLKYSVEETIDLWKSIRDEVKWRAENQIAAVGTERYRWMEAHPPTWSFLKYYRYMEKYGAVCVGSQYSNNCYAQLERKADGSIGNRVYTYVDEYMNPIVQPDGSKPDKVAYEPVYSPEMKIETREDEIRYAVSADCRAPHIFKEDEYYRPYALNEFADIYQVDGALLPLWRSGVGCAITRKEQAMRLRKDGINVYHYEGNQGGDNTDLDEKRMLEQLDQWMESQGLRKLDD